MVALDRDERSNSQFRNLFEPKAIAIVGASPDPSMGGNRPIAFLIQHGFKGEIYPVNPKYEEIRNLKAYPSILDIPSPVDTVMITVPEKMTIQVLADCAKKGVKLAIIRTAFDLHSETGQENKAFLSSLKKSGLRIMGPSSLGLLNTNKEIAANFHVCFSMEKLITGSTGIVSQSGGLSGVIFNKFQDQGTGLSYLFSTGIEADLEAADFINFLIEDPLTKVIACLIEGFKDPKRIIKIFDKAAEAKKPIVIMKLGRSELGMKAAQSHTGKMVGNDAIWDAIFKQKGVIRVDTLDEFVGTATLLANCRQPESDSIGIGVFASSGGAVTILVDQMGLSGLSLPQLSENTQEELKKILPGYASVGNPLDASPVGDERYLQCLDIFARDKNIDLIILPLTTPPKNFGIDRAREIIKFCDSIAKSVIVFWPGGSLVAGGMNVIENSNIPMFRSEEVCVKALRKLIDHHKFNHRKPDSSTLNVPEKNQDTFILNLSNESIINDSRFIGKALLEHYQIPIAQERVAQSLEEALNHAHSIGYPVALKVISPEIIHKTEFKAICLNIQNDRELKKKYMTLLKRIKDFNPETKIEGIQVQEMVSQGVEFQLGMVNNPELGPVMTCGFGGIFVELMKDIIIRIPPLDLPQVHQMIQELKGYALLRGLRGGNALDVDALIEAISNFSHLCVDLCNLKNIKISEMEINPLMVLKKGCGVKAVDFRVIYQ